MTENNPGVTSLSTALQSLDSTIVDVSTIDSSGALNDFFAKPVRVANGTWNSTDAIQSKLQQIDFPTAVFTNELYSKKLAGYMGFKATLVLKLQINGAPTQLGRLIMSWLPMGQTAGSYPDYRVRNLKSVTQLPHVIFDLGAHSEAVMEIPYISPATHYDLTNDTNPFGRAFLHVYTQLATGTSSLTADYTLWASFKDVSLVTPCYNAQMGAIKTKSKSKTEQEQQQTGPVSSILNTGASIASAISTIPTFTAIAQPASWVLASLGSLASAFGYSKPLNTNPAMRVTMNDAPFEANWDGMTLALPLSGSSENKVTILPNFAGSDVDQLSHRYVCGIPTYALYTTWSTVSGVDTSLYDNYVHPYLGSAMTGIATPDGHMTASVTPLGMCAMMYRYYRGSITLRITISKTAFHSGRLLFCFNPGLKYPNVAQGAYAYRQIIDLAEGYEWEITMPYASNTPWKTIPKMLPGINFGIYDDFCYGNFRLTVLNELVAPDTVSSTIPITIEVFSKDIEFAAPRAVKMIPTVYDYAPQMGELSLPSRTKTTPGTEVSVQDNVAPAEYCIGERSTSLLQLLKRSSLMGEVGIGQCITIRARTINAATGALGVDPTFHLLSVDPYTAIMSCYLFSRGGTRHRFAGYNMESNVHFTQLLYGPDIPSTAAYFASLTELVQPFSGVVYSSASDEPANVFVPQYTMGMCRMNRFSTVGVDEPGDRYSDLNYIQSLHQTGGNFNVFRGVADDFQAGFFVGTPDYITSYP